MLHHKSGTQGGVEMEARDGEGMGVEKEKWIVPDTNSKTVHTSPTCKYSLHNITTDKLHVLFNLSSFQIICY